MDMRCMKCAEPWDWWYIRDDVLPPTGDDDSLFTKMKEKGGFVNDSDDPATPYEVLPEKFKGSVKRTKEELEKLSNWQFAPGPYIIQCPACIGKEVEPNPNADIYAALQDILGDDIDGFMAEMEDFGL